MIFADMRGKLGDHCARAHERGEDVLTSTVFGLIRYLPIEEGLLRVLRRVRPVVKDDENPTLRSDAAWIDTRHVRTARVEFWPSFEAFGEPDVLLWLEDESGARLHVVLIEAKYLSPKSGRAEEDEVLEDERPHGDQLVKYWQGLAQLGANSG